MDYHHLSVVVLTFCVIILGLRYCICFTFIPVLPCSYVISLFLLSLVHFSALPAVVLEAIHCASGAWLWRYDALSCGELNSIHHRSGPLCWYWSSRGLTDRQTNRGMLHRIYKQAVVMVSLFSISKNLKCFYTTLTSKGCMENSSSSSNKNSCIILAV